VILIKIKQKHAVSQNIGLLKIEEGSTSLSKTGKSSILLSQTII
jgi:hypothetical protein